MKMMKAIGNIVLLTVLLLTIGLSVSEAEVTVYDAEGHELGILIGNSSSNTLDVYIPSVDRTLNINVSTGDILGRDMYFGSYDCSGTAYTIAEASYRIIKNGEGYYTGKKVAPSYMQINSALRSYNSACELLNTVRYVVPLQDTELPFPLPVSLPLSFYIEKKWKE